MRSMQGRLALFTVSTLLAAAVTPMALATLLPLDPAAAQTENDARIGVGLEAPSSIAGWGFDAAVTTATVTLSQGGDGDVEHTWDIPADFPDGGAWLTEGGFELFGPFEGEGAVLLAPGDVVTATMGSLTRSHTLIDVTVDDIDVAATMSGTAPVGTSIGVFAHSYEDETGPYQRWPEVQADGTWLADFAAAPDETRGEHGTITGGFAGGDHFHIVAFEEDGDETSLWRDIPVPPELYATTWPDPIIGGQGWEQSDVRIEIDVAPTDGTADFSADLQVGTWGDDRTYHLGDGFELVGPFVDDSGTIDALAKGDIVTVTGLNGPREGTAQQLTVQPVTITSVDRATGTITGTADPSVEVTVSRWGDDVGRPHEEVTVTADSEGSWTAVPGTLWAGSSGDAFITPQDGTWTRATYGVPFVAAGIDVDGTGPDGDAIWGAYWYLDTSIVVTVTRGDDVVHGPETVSPFDDWWSGFGTSLGDLQVGDVVTAAGQQSGTVASHEVVALTLEWDVTQNLVHGTSSAADGSYVLVEVMGYDTKGTTTVANGTWAVDFDELPEEAEPVQIGEDPSGVVQVLDGIGHRTFAPWGTGGNGGGEPVLFASATEQYVEGHGWFDDTSVNVSFGSCSLDTEVLPEEDASFWLSLYEVDPTQCGLEPDDGVQLAAYDTVTVTGTDSGTVRELTVAPLNVTAVDADAATVQGTADPGAEITVEAFGPEGPEAARTVLTQSDGTWLADLSTTIPDDEAWEQHFGTLTAFTEETAGSASQQDEDGDRTTAEWRVLQPTLLVMPHHHTIVLSDWPGDPITVTILSAGSAPELRLETTVTPEGTSYGHEVWLPLVFDLQPGQTVTASNGTTTRTMVVSTLTVGEFDFVNATVAGLTDPGNEVFVVVQDDAGERSTTATADSLGDWIAQFDTFEDAIEGAALVFGDFAHTVVQFVATYVGADVDAGGSVSTGDGDGGGDGASEDDPLNVKVTLPEGESGTVTLTETDANGTVTGDWRIVGSKINATSSITGTLSGPLELTVYLDASILGGVTAEDLTIFRNDVAVPACPETFTTQEELPCVASRANLDDGDVKIVVYTLQLSTWYAATPHEATVVAGLGRIEVPEPTVPVGTEIEATALFEGEVSGDISATFTWGDGTDTTTGSDGSTVTATHVYDTPGIYTVGLRVDIGETTYWRSYRYVTVYDPSGAFVTGGGWFDSPAGAYPADGEVTGPAALGFSARYGKRSATPEGDLEFTFEAGDLALTATSYDWLVVPDDHHAQLQGSAKVNEQFGYRFLLTATDPGEGPDTLRMKIWEEASGRLVYDNAIGAADDEMVGTPLGGGQIVIHAPRPPKNAR